VPFYCTVTTTESNDSSADAQTFVRSASVANSGPNDWNTAANWDGSAVPSTSGDTVYFEGTSYQCIYGMDQTATTLVNLFIARTQSGRVGGSAGAKLRFAGVSTRCDINYNPGGASQVVPASRINLGLGTSATAITVLDGPTSGADAGVPPITITVTHASATLTVKKGVVGVAMNGPTETSQLASVTTSYVTSKTSDADLWLGKGVTVGIIYNDNGTVRPLCGFTTLNWYGFVDTTGLTATVTASNILVNKGAKFRGDFRNWTDTNQWKFQNCGFNDVDIDWGVNFKITPVAL